MPPAPRPSRLLASLPLLAALGASAFPVHAAAAAGAPPPAQEVVRAARERAGREGKAVLVLFHASWCGWCRKLERWTESPAVRPVLDRSFETVWLTVLERGEKKKLENPGADSLLKSLSGGVVPGLPFFAVLDAKGKVLGTSIRPAAGGPGENVGFPATREEAAHVAALLRSGAPKASAAEIEAAVRAFGVPAS